MLYVHYLQWAFESKEAHENRANKQTTIEQ